MRLGNENLFFQKTHAFELKIHPEITRQAYDSSGSGVVIARNLRKGDFFLSYLTVDVITFICNVYSYMLANDPARCKRDAVENGDHVFLETRKN